MRAVGEAAPPVLAAARAPAGAAAQRGGGSARAGVLGAAFAVVAAVSALALAVAAVVMRSGLPGRPARTHGTRSPLRPCRGRLIPSRSACDVRTYRHSAWQPSQPARDATRAARSAPLNNSSCRAARTHPSPATGIRETDAALLGADYEDFAPQTEMPRLQPRTARRS
jgi:hypothetical protein